MTTDYFWGKIAIVTGGSKGIGRATTIALARTGCQVVFTYASDSGACTKLVTEVGENKVLGIKSNAGNIDDIECHPNCGREIWTHRYNHRKRRYISCHSESYLKPPQTENK